MTQRPLPAAALLAALPAPAMAEGLGPPLAWVPVALVVLVVALLLLALAVFIRRLQADGAAMVRQPDMTPERLVAWREMQAGLPDGTVRAAISIFIVAAGMLALMTSAWIGLPSTGEIGTIIGGVLGFYFGTRQNAGDGALARSLGGTATPVAEAPPAAAVLDIARRAAEAAAPLIGPTPARVLGAAGPLASLLGDALGGLRGGLAAPLAGLGGPPGLLVAVGLGAITAAGQGQAAYDRWKARVLDRPFTPTLFPPATLDGAVLLSVLEQAPLFARIFLDPLPPAARLPRALAVAEAARLADEPALAALQALTPRAEAASPDDWQAGLHAYRRLLLDALPGPDVAVDLAPVLGAGAPRVTGTQLAESLVEARAAPGGSGLDGAVLALLDLAEKPGTTATAMAETLRGLLPLAEAV